MSLNSKQLMRVALGAAFATLVAVTATSVVVRAQAGPTVNNALAPKPAVVVKYSQVCATALREWAT